MACVIAPVASSGSAQAESVQSLRGEAQQIIARINANGERISLLDDEINGAQIRLGQIRAEIRRTSLQIASAQRTIDGLHHVVVSRAAALYSDAGAAIDFVAQSAASVQQQGAMSVYSEASTAQDQQRIDAYRNARDARSRAEAELDAAERSADAQLASLEAQQREILRLNRQEQALYNQKNSQLRQAVVAAQQAQLVAERAASEARAARAAAAARSNNNGGGPIIGPVPAPNAGADAAVRYAMAQIGKPYLFGAAGPNSFDCSGLTMMAWAQAGVSLEHNADWQYRHTTPIPIADAQPGDLAFFGTTSYVHHVGLVIGNGIMVDAPYTTANVREDGYLSGWGLVGIGRP